MKTWSCCVLSITALVASASVASADMQGTGESGGWEKRIAVTPDPSKVVVPDGYEVSVFVAGLDTPSSATVDGEGNLWVAISGKLLGGPDPIDEPPYHFIIGNGNGMGVGEVAQTGRWRRRLWGAHMSGRNPDRNMRGIGICLIGDFETDTVPEDQLQAALALTRQLMERFGIPPENVTFHGGTPGEMTLCPGRKFPRQRFLRGLTGNA